MSRFFKKLVLIIATACVLLQVYKESGLYTVACFMLVLLELNLAGIWRREYSKVLDSIVEMTKKNTQHALEVLEVVYGKK